MMIPSQVLLIPHFVLYEALGLRMYQTATGSWINLLMAASLLSRWRWRSCWASVI